MKIEKLIIYGFGKHENVTVDVGSGITVLYGMNEAGKTTIQQFILHILFGFPQKNSAALRYEPKSGGKYGGQVHLTDAIYGKCIIERVRGKSAGDVTVYLEDGRTGGEEELRRILHQYDRASFESIFSFSLLQLQGFEKMGEEELSRTLLTSGTTGVDSLLQVDKKMEKEMGELFKKSGKNPAMNVKMQELRELEEELQDAREKVAEYAPAIGRLQEIDVRLTELQAQSKMLQDEAQQLSLTRQLLPLQQKKSVLEAQLAQLNARTFPVDGIRRYEALSDKWTEATARQQRLVEELAEMTERMPQRPVEERLAAIEMFVAKEAEWHGWRMTVRAATDDWQQFESRKSRLLDRLGVQDEQAAEQLQQANVSIQKEEEMHHLLGGLTDSDAQIGYAERQLVQLENDLMDIETKLGTIEQSAPTAEERKQAQEWPQIRQQLAEAKAYVAWGERQEEKNAAVPVVFAVLAVAVSIFGFIQKEWLIVMGSVIVGAVSAFFLLGKKSSPNDPAKMRKMERLIALYDGKEQQMEQLIERIANVKREQESLQQAYTALEQKHATVEAELDALYDTRRHVESKLVQFLRLYGFDGLPSPGIVPELFRLIREVQEVARDIEQVAHRRQMAQDSIANRAAEVEAVLQKTVPQEAMYEMLRREFLRLKEETETIESLQKTIAQQEAMLKETAGVVHSLANKLQALMAEAEVETEAEFYSAYDAYREAGRLTEQLQDLNMQFAAHGKVECIDGITEKDLVIQDKDNATKRAAVDEQITGLMNEKAGLIHKTERLLSDETYGQKQQLFEMKKAELAELAKKWSERKVITEAIRRTMTELKEKRLPEVLTVAEQLFCELTGGNYEALIVMDTGYFEVVSVDGMRYPIVELSQATKEQAYLALRLALAASILDTAPFPILMDDPFVHFDGLRLSRMIELVDQLQKKHQFIYFTCHEVMTEQWQDATILNVSAIGNEQGASIS